MEKLLSRLALPNVSKPSKGVKLELGRGRPSDGPIDYYIGKVPWAEIGQWRRLVRNTVSAEYGYEKEEIPGTDSGDPVVVRKKKRVYTAGMLDQGPLAIKQWRAKHEIREGVNDRVVLAQALHPLFNGPDSLLSEVYASKKAVKTYLALDDEIEVVYLDELPEHQEMFEFLYSNRSKEDQTFVIPEGLESPDLSELEPNSYSRAFLELFIVAYQKDSEFKKAVDKTVPSTASNSGYTLVEMAFRLADHLMRKNIQGGAWRQKKYNDLLQSIISGKFTSLSDLNAFLDSKSADTTARFMRVNSYDTYADSLRLRSQAINRRVTFSGIVAAGIAAVAFAGHLFEEYQKAQFEAGYAQAQADYAEGAHSGYQVPFSRFDRWTTTVGEEDEQAVRIAEDLTELAYQRYPQLSFMDRQELQAQFLAELGGEDLSKLRYLIGGLVKDKRLQADFVDSWYLKKHMVFSARLNDLNMGLVPYAHVINALSEPGVQIDSHRFDPYVEDEVKILGQIIAADPDGWCYELALAPSKWHVGVSPMGVSSRKLSSFSDDLVVGRECNGYEKDFFPAMGALGVRKLGEVYTRFDVHEYLPYISGYCHGDYLDVELTSDELKHHTNRNIRTYWLDDEIEISMKLVVDYDTRGGGYETHLMAVGSDDKYSTKMAADLVRSEGWCAYIDSGLPMNHDQSQLRRDQRKWLEENPNLMVSPESSSN